MSDTNQQRNAGYKKKKERKREENTNDIFSTSKKNSAFS